MPARGRPYSIRRGICLIKNINNNNYNQYLILNLDKEGVEPSRVETQTISNCLTLPMETYPCKKNSKEGINNKWVLGIVINKNYKKNQ